MTVILIPPLSPFPGRGAAPEDYIAQADTTMQELPSRFALINEISAALNLGAGVLQNGYLPPVPYAAGLLIKAALQTVEYAGATYAPLLGALPFTTSGVFEADKFRVIQGVTATALAGPGGAAGIGFPIPGGAGVMTTVEQRLLKSHYSDEYPTLRAAVAALGSTGGLLCVRGDIMAGNWNFHTDYLNLENVFLLGAHPPAYSQNCRRVIGPRVIGRFNVFASNFGAENVGFDCGVDVINAYYGGASTLTANHPLGDTWDTFAFAQPDHEAPLAMRRNLYLKNVICLNHSSATEGHGLLIEGVQGVYLENVQGMYGKHGAVVKANDVAGTYVAGWGASINDVVLKSDIYASCKNVKISILEADLAPPGTTPWSAPAVAQNAFLTNPAGGDMQGIKIGIARLRGAKILASGYGATLDVAPSDGTPSDVAPLYNLDNFHIASVEAEGEGIEDAIGLYFRDMKMSRVTVGSATINNVAEGVGYKQHISAGGFGAGALVIGTLRLGGAISGRGIQALQYGRIVIDHLFVNGKTTYLYDIDDTARVDIGWPSITAEVTQIFKNAPPALTSGWQEFGGTASSFRVMLAGYGLVVTGYLKPVGAGSPLVFSLPPYLRTAQATRRLTYGQGVGPANNAVLVNTDPGLAGMAINNNINIAGAEIALSLDGIAWQFD